MPDLTPQMERELAELEAALAPDLREARPEPRDAWVRRMDAMMAAEFEAAAMPRPSRGRRWAQLLLTAPALGTAAAAALIVVLVFSHQGGGTDDSDSGGGGAVAMEESGGGGGATASSAPSGGAATDSSAGAARSSEES